MASSSAAAVLAAIMGAGDEAIPAELPVEPRVMPPKIMRGDRAAINNCYSRNGRRQGAEGRTVVELTVQPDGSASELKFAPGIVAWQEQTARCVVAQMKFRPGERDGVPVAARVNVPIQFSLTDDYGRTAKMTVPQLRSSHDQIEEAYRACYPPDSVTIARPQYKVTIDASGKVTASELVESSGDEAMDRAGLCMFGRINFDPATRDDDPVSATLTLPMLVRPPK